MCPPFRRPSVKEPHNWHLAGLACCVPQSHRDTGCYSASVSGEWCGSRDVAARLHCCCLRAYARLDWQ